MNRFVMGFEHVTILDIDEENGFAIQEELNRKYENNKVKFIKCDVTQEQQLLDAFATVKAEQGYIDLVVNNAGIGNDKMFVREIEINLTAVVRITLHAWDLMRIDAGGRGGTVINVASIAAMGFVPLMPVYSATKAGVLKFGTTLGDEVHYTRTGVRILTVCFGLTDTQIVTKEKIGSFDPVLEKKIFVDILCLKMQTTEQAARGLTEMYKNGKSGTVWIVTSGKPAIDVTDKCVESTNMFNDIIFN